MPLKRNIYFKRREIEGRVISGDFGSKGKELVTTTWKSKIDIPKIMGFGRWYLRLQKMDMFWYPPGNDHISHQTKKGKNNIDSKVPAGRGYVIISRRVSIRQFSVGVLGIF